MLEQRITREPTTSYPEAGYCIYCGARNVTLTDEHIVPYGLFLIPPNRVSASSPDDANAGSKPPCFFNDALDWLVVFNNQNSEGFFQGRLPEHPA